MVAGAEIGSNVEAIADTIGAPTTSTASWDGIAWGGGIACPGVIVAGAIGALTGTGRTIPTIGPTLATTAGGAIGAPPTVVATVEPIVGVVWPATAATGAVVVGAISGNPEAAVVGAKVKGQRSKVKGQRSKVKGQRSKVKGQVRSGQVRSGQVRSGQASFFFIQQIC